MARILKLFDDNAFLLHDYEVPQSDDMPRIHWPRFEHPRPVEYWADGGLKQLFSTRDGGEICMQQAIMCCTTMHLTLFGLLAASTFYLIQGQLNLTSRCQILCKQSFLAKAMTPYMVNSYYSLACYHNMMLWPHPFTVEGIAAETQVLDVAVGFKKSSTSRNTGVQNINLLGTDFLDNFCLVDDHISQNLKVLPHYHKNLGTTVVPSLEQA